MSDERVEPFTVPRPGYGIPGMSERINKLMRSLMRHRERYIRAWIAHYGAHPADVHMVTRMGMGLEGGDVMRMEYRKDSDHVAELVKAARRVLDAEDRHEDRYLADILDPLEAALKPFEGR